MVCLYFVENKYRMLVDLGTLLRVSFLIILQSDLTFLSTKLLIVGIFFVIREERRGRHLWFGYEEKDLGRRNFWSTL